MDNTFFSSNDFDSICKKAEQFFREYLDDSSVCVPEIPKPAEPLPRWDLLEISSGSETEPKQDLKRTGQDRSAVGCKGKPGDFGQGDNTIPFAPSQIRLSAKERIKKMEQIPDYMDIVEGSGRHRFIFVFYCHCRLIYTKRGAVKKAVDLNDRFFDLLSEDELFHQLEKVDQHMEKPEWNLHGDGLYIFSTEKMIEFLPISIDAARELGFLKSFDKKTTCRRNQTECVDRDQEIAKLWLSGMSHSQISEAIDGKYKYTSLSTVKRVCKKLGLDSARRTDFDKITFIERYTRQAADINFSDTVEGNSDTDESVYADSMCADSNYADGRCQLSTKLPLKREWIMDALCSGENICLSGLAGTGKTYMIRRYIETVGADRTICVAAHGCAAQLIGGRTIHSMFAMESRVYGPHEIPHFWNFKRLADCDLLVIDEIGTVRFDAFAYIIKCVKAAERYYKKHIQIVVAGDFGQLSPVMTETEQDELESLWNMSLDGKKPFASLADDWVVCGFEKNRITLTKNHRQNQMEFLNELQKVYDRTADAASIQYFNSRVDSTKQYAEDMLHLCARKSESREVNRFVIAKHQHDASYTVFDGSHVVGTVNRAWVHLPLFTGMRVMMIKNTRQYVNGTMATVREIAGNRVWVELEDGQTICVRPMKIRDGKSSMIQLPLVPAYAITIHKAQGMSINNAVIHPGCFENGQLYTALSRVTSIQGLVLARPISRGDIFCTGNVSLKGA